MHLAEAIDKIHRAEASEFLTALPDRCIDLIVTSPPYWEPHAYGSSKRLGAEESWSEYVDNLMLLSLELQRVIKARGSYYLVIGDSSFNDERLGLPFRVRFALNETGWLSVEDIIWRKQERETPGSRRKFMSIHDFVFHFAVSRRYYSSPMAKAEFLAGDVWDLSDATAFRGKTHAAYPEEMCVKVILCSSPPGGIVLDPMCGTGTTCLVAKRLGRHFIGVDFSQENCRLARQRLMHNSSAQEQMI
jgi:DNA modification methylase